MTRFFTQLNQLMTPGVDLTIVVRQTGEKLHVIVSPKVETKDKGKNAVTIIPLVLNGTPAELDEGFLGALQKSAPEAQGLSSNIAAYKASLKRASDKLKKKGAASTTASPTSPAKPSPEELEVLRKEQEKQQRLTGAKDEAQLKTLLENPESHEGFKASLHAASVETLKTAWENSCGEKRKVVEAELSTLTGKTAKALGLKDQMDLFAI